MTTIEGRGQYSVLISFKCPLPQTMEPRQTSSRVQKLQADHLLSETAENTKTSATSAYSRNFEQNLVEHGVYPRGHEIKGKSLPEPSNVEEIREILFRPRESLILESDFRKFQRAEVRASKEKDVTTSVIPIFDGEINDDPKCAGGDYLFSNLAPLTDGSLAVAKPDHHFGVRPEDVNRQIRDELNHLIIPSTQSDLAICQSFFLELKGPDGTTAVVRRQACYDGALGARAMQALRCYGQKLSYDNKAYVITSAYYSGNLEIYATHVAKSTRRDGRPIYIMTLLDSFSMIGSLRAFRQGLTAYRNARDWTKERRDELIEAANKLVEGAHSQNSSSAQNQTPELVSNMGNSTSIGSTRPASSFIEDTQRKSKRVKIHSSESPGDTFDDDEEVAYPPSERGSKLDTNVRMG